MTSKNKHALDPRAIDMTGWRFGRLTVVASAGNDGRRLRWRCRCDCGAETTPTASMLRRGNTRSCGCLNRETRERGTSLRHGHAAKGLSPTYETWRGMRERCSNPKNEHWSRYGGRGIVVCERWDSFDNFLADMGERPDRMTIDRYPNNDGHYEPGNCRWATASEQGNNTERTQWLTLDGRTQTMTQWAAERGWHVSLICRRLKRGWSVDRALAVAPSRRGGNRRQVVSRPSSA